MTRESISPLEVIEEWSPREGMVSIGIYHNVLRHLADPQPCEVLMGGAREGVFRQQDQDAFHLLDIHKYDHMISAQWLDTNPSCSLLQQVDRPHHSAVPSNRTDL